MKKLDVADQVALSNHQSYCGESKQANSILEAPGVDSSSIAHQVIEAILTDERLVQRITLSFLTELSRLSFVLEQILQSPHATYYRFKENRSL